MYKIFFYLLLGLASCNVNDSLPNIVAEQITPNPVNSSPPIACTGAAWEVHFSPKGGSTDFLVQNINDANDSIYVQAYSFTSAPIADALIAKKKQGKTVVVVLDKSDVEGRGTQFGNLVRSGVPTYIDSKHAIAHNKIIIIDGKIVFTGSFNFTNAAENSNAENSIKLTDPKLAKVYQDNWEIHKTHSLVQKL